MSGADMVEKSYYKVKGRVPPVQLAESDKTVQSAVEC